MLMAYSSIKQGSKDAPYIAELVVNSEADIDTIPTHYAPGSTCIVIESSNVYMLNLDKEWKLL